MKEGQQSTSKSLLSHCRNILELNGAKAGERIVVATPYQYDLEFVTALLLAASEIGAHGAHLALIPGHEPTMQWPMSSIEDPRTGLTSWHWDLYAGADLLITTRLGASDNAPFPYTDYVTKVGDHSYRTDFEYISRPGSRTRWLQIDYSVELQRRYFPTTERAELTLRGAKTLDECNEIRVTSEQGSDFTAIKEGRPGMAQIGYSDVAGRWDNFAYGCVLCAPNEYKADGVFLLEPGDIIPNLNPQIIQEAVKITFAGGYVTSIEGGATARSFNELLASYDEKEAYGISHIGWGTHEATEIGNATPAEISHYHHNAIGTVLVAIGTNMGHGTGGQKASYSGLGMTTRKAPNHTHFMLHHQEFYGDGKKIVENGVIL